MDDETTPQTSMATSSGQTDSGMFELNFRDERYLPFEGAGAVSRWRLELPAPLPQFDYGSIADVLLHVLKPVTAAMMRPNPSAPI